MQKQVEKNSYQFEYYVGIDRWSSYYYQLREIMEQKTMSVLEVGIGDHVVGNYLKGCGIAYTSVDSAEDLSPDVVADITKLPFENGAFDAVCAFEVLEHIPFEDFGMALAELARVSKKHILISLPHFGPAVKFLLKLPLLPEIRFAFKIHFPRRHESNSQHHWEIGERCYPLTRIRTMLLKHFVIRKEFVPFGNQYHHFFVLEKK